MEYEKMVNSKFYIITDWLFKLFMLNVLWFFFNVIGLIIFAIFPATVAIFIVINELIHEKEFPLFKTFFNVFKKIYWRSQKVFSVIIIFALLIFNNLNYFNKQIEIAIANNTSISGINSIGLIITTFLTFLLLLTLLHLIPLMVYYPSLSVAKLYKSSFVLALAYPLTTALLTLAILPTTILSIFLPPAAAFVLIAIPAYLQLIIVKPIYSKALRGNKMITIDELLN